MNDENEIKHMPLCAEKLLINLINLLEKSDFTNGFEKEWKELEKRLKIEGLDSQEVNQITEEINSLLNQRTFAELHDKLKRIQSLLRDLNVPKLLRMIKENNDALDKVKNKNIYLFIGLTKSGKNVLFIFFNKVKTNIRYK